MSFGTGSLGTSPVWPTSKKAYGTFQPKDLELDPFMLVDALEVFGKTSAAKSIGYGMDVLIDLVLSGRPYLRQADRKARKTACCAACNDPLFRPGSLQETAGGGVVICDVCNEWVHLGDPLNGDSCFVEHMATHMKNCVCLGLRTRGRCREYEQPSSRPRSGALELWETRTHRRIVKGQGSYPGGPYVFFDPMDWSDDDEGRDAEIK